MNDKQINTFTQIENFLDGTTSCDFVSNSKEETYKWITDVLIKFSYYKLEKSKKSLVRNYLKKVTGYSHSQLTRLIKSQKQVGRVVRKRYLRNVFSRKYLAKEIVLLAQTDELHDNPNGKAIKRILEREWQIFKKEEFKNLSKISASHIYNLRSTVVYKRVNKTYEKTKSVESPIGERRKPQPNGRPGYLRVDSVHQGKKDNKAGVYHINIVDEVTQFDFVGAVETISENYMIPMLEQLIDIYPFIIFEIHADNGSEYINQFVANMLNKLVIELTKNRPRHCNDNALVESKNASVIRKWIGYSFMPKEYAKKLNDFYFGIFHEYINYHRPCAFPKIITNKKGKQRKIYPQENYMTPFEKFKSIPNCEQFLKLHATLEQLEQIAHKYSDNEIAKLVQKERNLLFN